MALCCVAAGCGISSCSSSREPASGGQAAGRPSAIKSGSAVPARKVSPAQAGPPVVIYKTTRDYSRNVPVGLSEDGTRVVSYPAVSDVKVGGRYPYPTPLEEGYLLDNRGIGPDVAFLSYTYEEYAALPATPSSAELLEKVIDKRPLVEIHACGNRYQYKDLVKELNERIRAGAFKK
ncbi:MAG: hypothetical protein PHC95_12405 [Parabacteroides sp.]|nr:hypothetical protein [Parabacteroides sp.]